LYITYAVEKQLNGGIRLSCGRTGLGVWPKRIIPVIRRYSIIAVNVPVPLNFLQLYQKYRPDDRSCVDG